MEAKDWRDTLHDALLARVTAKIQVGEGGLQAADVLLRLHAEHDGWSRGLADRAATPVRVEAGEAVISRDLAAKLREDVAQMAAANTRQSHMITELQGERDAARANHEAIANMFQRGHGALTAANVGPGSLVERIEALVLERDALRIHRDCALEDLRAARRESR